MAERQVRRATNAGGASRKQFEVISFRAPVRHSQRLQRFCEINRLTIDESFVFLMNVSGVGEDGKPSRPIDYILFDEQWAEATKDGYADHTMRMEVSQSGRMKKLKQATRFAMGQLITYLMDGGNVHPAGESPVWINYETMRPRTKAEHSASALLLVKS